MPNGTFLKEEEKEDQRFYRFSSWWVNNRENVKKAGYGLFIAVDAIVLLYVVVGVADAYLVRGPVEDRAVLEMVAYGQADLNAYTRTNAAKDLNPSDVTVITAGPGTFDLYATLSNPNDDWWAEFDYVFRYGTETSRSGTGFILPSEEKPIVTFGIVSESAPRGSQLEFTNLVWHRVDQHLTGPYEAWVADRMRFTIENPAFTIEEIDTRQVGRAVFDVKNDSAYSYYQPGFFIILSRGSAVVGVNRTALSSLDSGEAENVVVNWFGTLPSASKVEIIPEINIFDLSAYKPLTGESTTDTRTRVFERRR